LERLGVPHHIGGSVASSTFGFYRTTADVDLVADLRSEHVEPLVEQLQESYYVDGDMILEATRDRGSFNVIFLPTVTKVDVFIPKGEPYDRVEAERVRRVTVEAPSGSRLFPLSSPEDIVLRKLEWYRAGHEVSERQWLDLSGVLKVQAPNLDLPYLRGWAQTLGLAELLDRALSDAGI